MPVETLKTGIRILSRAIEEHAERTDKGQYGNRKKVPVPPLFCDGTAVELAQKNPKIFTFGFDLGYQSLKSLVHFVGRYGNLCHLPLKSCVHGTFAVLP